MEILVIGFIRGSLYSLVVIGFVLVFSVGGILNLCHGILYMMGENIITDNRSTEFFQFLS